MNNKLHNIQSSNKEIKENWIDSSKQSRKKEIPGDLTLSQDNKLEEDAYQNIEIILAIGWVLLIYFFY